MSSNKKTLLDDAVTAMNQIFHAVQAGVLPPWLQVELTMGQCKAAMFLAHQGPMTIGQLACALGIGQPAASILVDRLVQHGLVQRTEDLADRRRTWAQLNPKGRKIIDSFDRYRLDRLSELLGRLEAEDLSALVRGLRALAAVAMEDQALRSSQNTVAEARPIQAPPLVGHENRQ